MKILWIKTDFLHPTTRGGQIRTLEMLKRLHQKHEVHYVGLDSGETQEGPARAGEYSAAHYAIPHKAPNRGSVAFASQVAQGLFSTMPVSVFRYRSPQMRDEIERLTRKIDFDSVVCDFLFPAPNVPDLGRCVLFQHNVEAMIWRRHAEHGRTPLHRWYFERQYQRMHAYEKRVCQTVRHVVAVSPMDAAYFESEYGLSNVSSVATGVDLEYFTPPPVPPAACADLVFVGSMDWLPNIDGVQWFMAEVLPLIWASRPETTVAVVGRKPSSKMLALAEGERRIQVTGTVPDVRPWLHGSTVSIVPLRIGGGTRIKIYEAMAARVPVVSTTIGAEGLDCANGVNIRLADSPADFAAACVALLQDAGARRAMVQAAWQMVADRYSWDAVTNVFAGMIAP
ncbi:MAG: glycosyltransferase [Bryobacteraceae bacterium]